VAKKTRKHNKNCPTNLHKISALTRPKHHVLANLQSSQRRRRKMLCKFHDIWYSVYLTRSFLDSATYHSFKATWHYSP